MSDGRCIHCGQKGHYSMMCPKKQHFSYEPLEYSTKKELYKGDAPRNLKLGRKKRFSVSKSF
ncbi:hypothetical protein BCR42DRAFT_399869 [Absidia repens]|uniref:CCHC-type domain-containing protein n=1 Tax=Absidia repens TaxID=90262 RepID=A0A1X2J0H3_9FUNG|nr:hypothetical protein BCR42DRAFT_399869 [Absidia repens]